MRFSYILHQVYCVPWNIIPAAHVALGTTVSQAFHTFGTRPVNADRGPDIMSWDGAPLPQMRVEDGVSIIPCQGTIVRGATQIEKSCGMLDVEDIRKDIKECLERRDVDQIFLDWDSPGGMSNGSTELAQYIASVRGIKPLKSWVAGTLGSAAFDCAASTEIWAAPSAQIGSIGSYIAFLDASRAYEIAGYKMELIASGPLKGAGIDGISLTDEQRAYFQEKVNQSAENFKSHVRAWRPQVAEETMQGGAYLASTTQGENAYNLGLIDGTANSLDELLGQIR
jgi:ClpP class serine protease